MEIAKEKLISESRRLLELQRNSCDYPSHSAVLTYRPGEDDRVFRSEVIEKFVTGLHPSQDIAAAATLGNMFVLNAAPNYCSENLLSMADLLHTGGTSTLVMEMASKRRIASSRKSIMKRRNIVLVDSGNFQEHVAKEIAKIKYGETFTIIIHDNLQWRFKDGKYVHSTTGVRVHFNKAVLGELYLEAEAELIRLGEDEDEGSDHEAEDDNSQEAELIRKDEYEGTDHDAEDIFSKPQSQISESSNTQNDILNDAEEGSDTTDDTVNAPMLPVNPLDQFDKTLPDLDSFNNKLPLFTDSGSERWHQHMVTQLFIRMIHMGDAMANVGNVFGAAVGVEEPETVSVKRKRQRNVTSTSSTVPVEDGGHLSLDEDEVLDAKNKATLPRAQTVFDIHGAIVEMMVPLMVNFASILAPFGHPMNMIDMMHLGEGSNDLINEVFQECHRLLIVAEDGAPYRGQMNVQLTKNEDLHPKLLKCKAYLHVMFPVLGAFHTKVKFAKNVFTLFAPFLKECMTLFGRISLKQQSFTLGMGRYDNTFEHIFLIQHAISFTAIRAFIVSKSSSGQLSNINISTFAEWLSKRNSKARTALLFMIYMEPFYLMNFTTRDIDFDTYVEVLVLTLQFDVAFGDKEYALMKANFVLRTATLSPYWYNVFKSFFFSVNLNGKGVELDLLCEYIHNNVKMKVPHVGHISGFSNRLAAAELTLPEVTRSAANLKARDKCSRMSHKNIEVTMQYKNIDWNKVKALAGRFDSLGLWDDDNSAADVTAPVLTSLMKNETYAGEVAQMYSNGEKLIPSFFDGFSDNLVSGMKESRELWGEHIDRAKGMKDGVQEEDKYVDLEEGVDDDVDEDEDDAVADDTDAKKIKTKPRWKPTDISGSVISDLNGSRIKLKKLDMQVLSILESTRVTDDDDASLLQIYKSATADVLKALLQYYLDVLEHYVKNLKKSSSSSSNGRSSCTSSRSSSSSSNEGGSSSSSSSSCSSSTSSAAGGDINLSDAEFLATLDRIIIDCDNVLKKKTKTKQLIFDALMSFRNSLSAEMNELLCQCAKASITGVNGIIDAGDYNMCWGPWARRFCEIPRNLEEIDSIYNVDESLCLGYNTIFTTLGELYTNRDNENFESASTLLTRPMKRKKA